MQYYSDARTRYARIVYWAVYAADKGSNRFFALSVNEKLRRSEIYGVSFRARVQVIPNEKQTLHTCPQTVRYWGIGPKRDVIIRKQNNDKHKQQNSGAVVTDNLNTYVRYECNTTGSFKKIHRISNCSTCPITNSTLSNCALTLIEEHPESSKSVPIVYGGTFVPENFSVKETQCQCTEIYKTWLDD